ncbi:Rieske 2Fe-2S domain-containing protein [Ferrimicrobium sp.]|uniref:Rieske 2Fe-2S domain-containing protein n=1 Tax=Ferrimicrobium sp. TaxID=2926050 RepID=UPI00260EA2B5|nr:Rieske 2Fe-2S domain-containing protein [Ferrimicrobium sp.]
MKSEVEVLGWDEVEDLMGRIDSAIAALDALEPEARAKALQLKEVIEEFYAAALRQVVLDLRGSSAADELRELLLDDPVIVTAMSVARLTPPTLAQRVVALLESLHPQLKLQGAEVTLERIEGSRVVLHTAGSASGCGAMDLQRELGELIRSQLHECTEVVFVEDAATPIPNSHELRFRRFVTVADLSEIPDSHPFAAMAGKQRVVVVKVGEKIACFRNECAHQGLPIHGASIDECTLTCRWHGFQFDALTGEGITIPGVDLEPVAVRIRDGAVQVMAES